MVANHENEDWINGEKTEDIVAFLDRLYTAKRKVEKRIAVLGGESDSVRPPPPLPFPSSPTHTHDMYCIRRDRCPWHTTPTTAPA